MMRTVDLFAGSGGLSLGFMNAGFDVVAAFEKWDKAIEIYRENITDHPVVEADLSDVEKSIEQIRLFNPEMIIGGPPCQDYSSAGKRIETTRADLTRSFALIISSIKPKIFVMENVARARLSKAYADARAILTSAGYGITETVLNADLCGVPQNRGRFFAIGILGADSEILLPYLTENLSDKPMTVRDYFGDSLGIDFYYRHPRSYARRGIYSIDEPSATIRGVNRPVPPGYKKHPLDAIDVTPNLRPLTTLERSLIQTFPPQFKWTGSKTNAEQMIGNAVPVKLAEYVALAIKKFIDSGRIKPIVDEPNFKKWLIEEKGYSDRSSNDIVSRVKRANGIVSVLNNPGDYSNLLEQSDVFAALKPSIKSQLKKAICLYYEYGSIDGEMMIDNIDA